MKLWKAPHERAAVASTAVVVVALFPLWYAQLMIFAHLPPISPYVVLVSLLGLPGLFIVERLAGSVSSNTQLFLAAVVTWMFYFPLFWLGFHWLPSRNRALIRKREQAKGGVSAKS